MPRSRPTPAESALPPVAARIGAFVAILAGGATGGLIGYSFSRFQCEGDCTLVRGGLLVGGALVGAVGVAVVAVITLRVLAEWGQSTSPPSTGPRR